MIPLFRVNAFVNAAEDGLRSGNPAAVVLLTAEQNKQISDATRQSVAKGLNLSETAYVSSTSERNKFALRWFTPKAEVSMCGHATLAAAAALRAAKWVGESSIITFETLSGTLTVTLGVDTRKGAAPGLSGKDMLSMRFPLLMRHESLPADTVATILSALHVEENLVEHVYMSDFDVVVALHDEKTAANVHPDLSCLSSIPVRGFILAARSSGPASFVSRFFAPRFGISEDPVTGSAHCALAALYLQEEEQAVALQLSSRGGQVHLQRKRDNSVLLRGSIHIVYRSSLSILDHE